MPSALSNVCVSSSMYADDLAVQISCSNFNLANQLLSHFNSVAEDWTAANALCLNMDKTQSIKFSLSNFQHKAEGVDKAVGGDWTLAPGALPRRLPGRGAAVEGGFLYTGKEQVEMTAEFYQKLRSVSPIQYADKVKAPTLLSIGKKDLRVPPSQGILYYHTLKTYNIPCKMNVYDDKHSLMTVPADIDSTINAVLWFQKHLASKA
ncbi:hypothetical protein J6590_085923 [Homalodisca vitripennis]|nr:hypothetical protein J6590_085923 [Homalodisca vitripennis]